MAVYRPVGRLKKVYGSKRSWGPYNFLGQPTGPYTAIWPEVSWTICYIMLFTSFFQGINCGWSSLVVHVHVMLIILLYCGPCSQLLVESRLAIYFLFFNCFLFFWFCFLVCCFCLSFLCFIFAPWLLKCTLTMVSLDITLHKNVHDL